MKARTGPFGSCDKDPHYVLFLSLSLSLVLSLSLLLLLSISHSRITGYNANFQVTSSQSWLDRKCSVVARFESRSRLDFSCFFATGQVFFLSQEKFKLSETLFFFLNWNLVLHVNAYRSKFTEQSPSQSLKEMMPYNKLTKLTCSGPYLGILATLKFSTEL